MTTKDILQAVQSHWQASEVVLVREGLFWRAYEQSALALCEWVHPFKLSTRYVKCVAQWICNVGFPDSAKDKWLASRQVKVVSDSMITFSMTEAEKQSIDDAFADWKRGQVAEVAKNAEKPSTICSEPSSSYVKAEMDSAESEVIQMIRSFAVENATPLACMNFVADIKQKLYEGKV